MHTYYHLFFFVIFFFNCFSAQEVFKKTFSNGLTALVKPVKTTQKVSVQMWYPVGSKHEQSGEKGIAHLIEHEIFKGTEKLSESDIGAITHKLAGSTNAATSYDWTHYYINVPERYWKQVLPIMADCMQNCSFKDDLLNAEYKAVIQELNMNQDNYGRILFQKLMSSLFHDHPYHYPIIGYKYDLWSLSGADLKKFYKKYYGPDHALLVIVGNVDPEDVFKEIEKEFGSIPRSGIKLPTLSTHFDDFSSHEITVYRDVTTPHCIFAFTIPGLNAENNYLLDILSILLTDGKTSFLHHKLVDELKLVSYVDCSTVGLFCNDLLLLSCQPYNVKDIALIKQEIQKTLDLIASNKIDEASILTAQKKARTSFYRLLESNGKLANMLAMLYLATHDENALFNYDKAREGINKKLRDFAIRYLRPCQMHTAILLPLDPIEKKYWEQLQQDQIKLDTELLKERIRESDVEEPKYALSLKLDEVNIMPHYPKPEQLLLKDNLTILSYNNSDTPLFALFLKLKAEKEYDSDVLQGIYHVLCYFLEEAGTKNYTADQFAQLLESHAINFNIAPGLIAMSGLKEDLSLALELLTEKLTNLVFDQSTLEKVRNWALQDLKNAQDSPGYHSVRLTNEILYKNHPYSKNQLGTEESIKSIAINDLKNFYQQIISPQEAVISLVGDLTDVNLQILLEKTIGTWQGNFVNQINYNALEKPATQTISFKMDRNQTVLTFAGHSISRLHADYDRLHIFEQIFSRGMHSVLFQLREQTGLFYSIFGSMTKLASDEPGIWEISCLVSPEKVEQAKRLIQKAILNAADCINDQAIQEAKRVMILAADDIYSTNTAIAGAFLLLHKYKLPWDYFEKRIQQLSIISAADIKEAVKKVLNPDSMITIQVGNL